MRTGLESPGPHRQGWRNCRCKADEESRQPMSRDQSTFPLFNRIVVLVMSSALAIGIPVGVVQIIRKGDGLDLVTGFLMLVFFAMACGGIWFSVAWRNKTSKELEEEQAFPTPGEPDISDDALVYRFSNGFKSAAIYIDETGGVIHFHNCHTSRRFLSSSSTWFSCPIDDVKGAHVFRYRGESLTVVTETGKALIPKIGTGYAEFRDTIKRLVPGTQPGFSTDHPMMGMVYLAGALIGLFGGFALTPQDASDATVGVFVLAGSALGVAASYFMVHVGDRWLKIGLAQPIGFGMAGLIIAMMSTRLLRPILGWNATPFIALSVIGGVMGFAFGVSRQLKERR